jgi:TetR/AcrR family transcriptional regulator, cholesterol catabolism regulator
MASRVARRFDRKLDGILRQAAVVFCARGYHQASIRDIARATGVSLAGLYYYFSSKEHLLYLIQRHAFKTLLAESRSALAPLQDPEERLRRFIRLHLEYFIQHPNEMKVLTHEERSLEDARRRDIHDLKKAYYQLCFDQVEALKDSRKLPGLNTRVAALALFGMMNWLYTWYKPKVDPDAEAMARQMTEIFLHGAFGEWARRGKELRTVSPELSRNDSRLRGSVKTALSHDARGSRRRRGVGARAAPGRSREAA